MALSLFGDVRSVSARTNRTFLFQVRCLASEVPAYLCPLALRSVVSVRRCPAPTTTSRNKSTVAQAQDKPTEMVGHESEVATWNLRRGRDWPVVKAPVRVEGHVSETFSSASAPNWLSFAELRTSSQSPLVLPQSLYLSHQFSFHALGDDYHGRLRRFQLDALGPKIEVRKEVEISAYSAGAGEAFIHGSHDTGRASSSFD
ncbi:hypothetical protein H4582DRAFT_1004728 [Lactarius indigo]|nr:hypothetical protein H4582DRAFT_1004728 [Lactarius indigo]